MQNIIMKFIIFEIGWKAKNKEKYDKNSYIIKDDILVIEGKEIVPL